MDAILDKTDLEPAKANDGRLRCMVCGLHSGDKVMNQDTGKVTGLTFRRTMGGYICQCCGGK